MEIPKGCRNKYEYDKKSKKIFVDRVILMSFPTNYGFICDQKGNSITLGEDGDDIDVICLGDPVIPNCIMPIRVIGALRMLDNGKRDDKLLAVNVYDSKWNHLNDLEECKQFIKPTLDEISFFLDCCKDWKRKKGSQKNTIVEEWVGKEEALKILEQGFSFYQKYKKKD